MKSFELDPSNIEIPSESTVANNFIKDERLKAMLFCFDKGEELTDHTSSRLALIHVIEGEGSFSTSSKEVDLKPHTFILIEPNEEHAVIANTQMKLYLYLFDKG